MNDELLLDAMDHLDDDIVGDYVKLKLRFQDRCARKKSALIGKISLIAAAFVLAFAAVIMWQSGIFYSAEAVAPDMSKVVWDTSEPYSGGPIPTDIPMINGVRVSRELRNVFENNDDEDAVFALSVHLLNDADIEKASRYFAKKGIYCEVRSEKVFIFVTEEQFCSLRFSSAQKKDYSFSLIRKEYYDNALVNIN